MSSVYIINNNVYYKNNPQFFNKLLELINNRRNFIVLIQNNPDYKYLKDWIDEQLPILNSDFFKYSYKTKIYWIFNNLIDFPICPVCKSSENYKNKNINIFNKGYSRCCCKKCASEDPVRHEKIRQTHLNKAKTDPEYWNKQYEKTKKTVFEKYGVENPSQSDIIKNKKIETFYKHYGVQYGFQAQIVKDKIESTMLKLYNVKHILQSEKYMNAFKQTCIDRFGVDHPMHNDVIRRKTRKGYLFNKVYFDSSWELCLYIYLKDNGIDFSYQPNDCDFKYVFNNKIHNYFPDFKIGNQYYEIKGDHMINPETGHWIPPPYVKKILSIDQYKLECERTELKYQCAIQHNIKILTHKDCQLYLDYIINKYGKNYIKQFKIKKST